MSHTLHKNIISVKQLLSISGISVPVYQRPYKWTEKNVTAIIKDLCSYRNKSAYRLGTIVFYNGNKNKDSDILEIVDGQQRIITLMLIVKALLETRMFTDSLSETNENNLEFLREHVDNFLKKQTFKNKISLKNLNQNYAVAKRLVMTSDFTNDDIYFLLNKCELVTFVLTDISECFQFFDSQNARGKDLEPHDLLKAFHLREFDVNEESIKLESVSGWEGLDSADLAKLFASYLYRIKRWSGGDSARYFTKNEIDLFKGINITQSHDLNYAKSLNIVHHYVDDFNKMYHRKIDGMSISYPFQLDQKIINGRRFFEMAVYYHNQIREIIRAKSIAFDAVFFGEKLNKNAAEIFKTLNTYKQRNRTGDKYVLELFHCALIFYIDKFGVNDICFAIEKIFIWAYTLRITHEVVQFASVDNYVKRKNLFKRISYAISSFDALAIDLDVLSIDQNKNNHQDPKKENELVKLFRGMNYYE